MEPFELYAIRYAVNGPRTVGQNIMGGDPHEADTDLDFFVWVARRSDRVFLIDTGSGEQAAVRRKYHYLRAPADALGVLGIVPAKLEDVILTHAHYDHAGMLHRFAAARFHLQDSEMDYMTGRCMCAAPLRRGYEVDDILPFVRCVHADKVVFQDRTQEIAPGLTVDRVGGHSGALQVVRVWTKRGWVVIASDASHLCQNMMEGLVFPSLNRVDDMFEGFSIIRQFSGGSWKQVIPDHDPLVVILYPAASAALEGIVARLDETPREMA